jgi:multicomponent Na+:H+ antiporter subunit B
MVTVTLADYRGFDTLGETLVVLTAGMACWLILRRRA